MSIRYQNLEKDPVIVAVFVKKVGMEKRILEVLLP